MKSSIIICAYNEEKTVSKVVRDCCEFRPEDEVIVVDDGSTDDTARILGDLSGELDFHFLRLEENRGKSWAMVRGVEDSSNDIIIFFDADVTGIKGEHFERLINPIIDGTADMTLGQPSETFIDYRLNPFRSLTGERAMLKTDILPILDDIWDIRFGVETFMNLSFQSRGKRIMSVILDGLAHPNKYEKTTPLNATKEFISEGHEIAATLLNNPGFVVERIKRIIS